MLTQALEAYGVREAVTSPGSRNAPLVVAAQRCGALRLRTVIDERSAAFIALGIAQTSMRPVALICTSGTALLNYAPAVAEAYYRKTPLIVISADRTTARLFPSQVSWTKSPSCPSLFHRKCVPTTISG